jgi:hypothetical protein
MEIAFSPQNLDISLNFLEEHPVSGTLHGYIFEIPSK